MPCTAPTITLGGVTLSTSTFENAQELIKAEGSDQSDPTADEFESYIASGNNTKGTKGIHEMEVLPTQTTPPTVSPVAAKETIITPPPPVVTKPTNTSEWDGQDYDVQLSTNFKLRALTISAFFPNPLILLTTIPIQTRFNNLQGLAQNVLEPLYEKFGKFRINSGIRNEDSVKPPGMSQHLKGQAADIQFAGWTYDMYWDNAPWIKDNIPYDQFIFEHSEKTRSVWLHLSYSLTGGRPATSANKVLTMYKGHYDSGLKRYY